MVPPRDPLVLPLIALICGIAAARYTSFSPVELAVTIGALLGLCILSRFKAPRVASAPGLCALVLAGCALAEYHRSPARPELTEEDNQVLIVGGCVVEPPSPVAPISRFVVELEPRARVRISLTPRDGEQLPAFRYGDVVDVEARVRKPVNFGNAGAFDFAGYLARQDVYWTASARGVDKLRILSGRCGSAWHQWWFSARSWALHRIQSLFAGDTYTIAMMSGMLLGDVAGIERSWTDGFRRTGTYHTLVISGLHITVLAGALLTALRLAFVPMGIRLLIAAMAAWAYALLTAMQTPVARSAAGFTLFLIASYFYRRGRVLNLLAAVALVFLLTDPDQIADASFQLSFLAVMAIGAIAMPVMERSSTPLRAAVRRLSDPGRDAVLPSAIAAMRVEFRLLAETVSMLCPLPPALSMRGIAASVRVFAYAYDLVLVSAAVQLALVLPSVAYFHRLSLTSLTANTFAVPVLSAAVPFGFIAVLTGFTLPASIAAWLLDISRVVVEWHAGLEPPSRIPDLPLLFQASVAAVLIVAGVAIYFAARWRTLLSFASVAIVAVIYFHPFRPNFRQGHLEVTSIDVGQGDSHLVVGPSGETLLVDGGGIPTFDPKFKPKLEIGEDVVSPYLWNRGLKRLDVIALTHAHDDHARGLLAVMDNFRPRELWTGAQPVTGVWLELQQKAREIGVKIVERHSGEQWQWGKVAMRVYAPTSDRLHTEAAQNNDSLVLQVGYGKHKFLLTGDIERQVEQELVASGALMGVDVLKVAHHGSRTSTTPELLEALRPAFAIVSAGRYNSYRHPHPDVVARLESFNTRVLQTGQYGSITFDSDGKRIGVETNRWQGNTSGIRHPLAGD